MTTFMFYATPFMYTVLQLRAAQLLAPHTNIPGICWVATLAVGLWVAFHACIVPVFGNVLLFKVYEVPLWVKCPVEHIKCERGDVDGWSLWHLGDHFVMGFLYPHIHLEAHFVFFQSLLCELGEVLGGERARFIVDPGINLLGYMLGCWARRSTLRQDGGPLAGPSRGVLEQGKLKVMDTDVRELWSAVDDFELCV